MKMLFILKTNTDNYDNYAWFDTINYPFNESNLNTDSKYNNSFFQFLNKAMNVPYKFQWSLK
jgi:hypothetical protein